MQETKRTFDFGGVREILASEEVYAPPTCNSLGESYCDGINEWTCIDVTGSAWTISGSC